jgi:transcriptional regulator with XRE-family HTH domain
VFSKLAAWRVKRGVTQAEMAAATGIPLSTYWRLERRRLWNPPIRHLTNCAIVLGCELEDLIEDDMRTWKWSRAAPDEPPDPSALWREDMS